MSAQGVAEEVVEDVVEEILQEIVKEDNENDNENDNEEHNQNENKERYIYYLGDINNINVYIRFPNSNMMQKTPILEVKKGDLRVMMDFLL
jgi:hypothetical protein